MPKTVLMTSSMSQLQFTWCMPLLHTCYPFSDDKVLGMGSIRNQLKSSKTMTLYVINLLERKDANNHDSYCEYRCGCYYDHRAALCTEPLRV